MPSRACSQETSDAEVFLDFNSFEKIDHSLTRAYALLEVMTESFANKSRSYFDVSMIALDEINQALSEVKKSRKEGTR